MKRVGKEHSCYAMSPKQRPVLTVREDEPFVVETQDCYSDNLRSSSDRFTQDMWKTVNPATGPIAIIGARPGGILRVEVMRIRTRDYAVMCVEHGSGALGEWIEGVETTILPIRKGRLILNRTLSIPVRPMIGVIGTAPRGEAVLNGTPGEHGGNMDCKLITAGSVVYLPVEVAGALLSLGDLHAVMGDGEVCICAAEVSGEVVLRARLARNRLPTPCVETDRHVHVIGSALSLDECERLLLGKVHAFLTSVKGLSPNAAARLMSLAGDLEICQVVDPLKTMRFTLPKELICEKPAQRVRHGNRTGLGRPRRKPVVRSDKTPAM